MLETLCKELGLQYDGRWTDIGGYQFTIINHKLISNGASFTVFNTDRLALINAINDVESKHINYTIKNKEEEEVKIEKEVVLSMCKNTSCIYALTRTGEVVDWCSFYEKGRNMMPTGCQIPFLCNEEDVIDLVDEVLEL